MKREKEKNDIPYLIDFANNIGLNQHQLAIEMGEPNKALSAWAIGRYRPKDYDDVRVLMVEIIETKLKADAEEWKEFKEKNG